MATVSDEETKLILGPNVRRVRIESGISMAELGRRCFTCASAIKDIEEGNRMPGAGLLTRIADALGIGVGSLLTPKITKKKKGA